MITLLLSLFVPSLQADIISQNAVEVPIMQAFIPTRGYDDNDRVTAVIMGELPNPCYSIDGVEVVRDDKRQSFEIKQMAIVRTDGACGHGDLIDDPVPYSSEVSLGQIGEGSYRLFYQNPSNKKMSKPFYVQKAQVASLDNFNYAAIDHVAMHSYYSPTDTISVEIGGALSSSCAVLETPVRVEQQGDVFVFLPVIKKVAAEKCEPVKKSFHQQIELGKLPPGTYAIHARSRNGRAVHHVFSVVFLPAVN